MSSWGEDAAHSLTIENPNYDKSWYVGAGLGAMTYEQNGLSAYRMQDRRLIFGKQLNREMAVEVHLGSSSSDTKYLSGVPVKLTVNNYIAGFFKGNITFTSKDWDYNRFRLYGMVGGTRIKSTSSDPGYSRSGVQTSIAAGVGMEFFLDNVALQLGYTRYASSKSGGSNYTLDSLHLGVIYQFGQDVANAR